MSFNFGGVLNFCASPGPSIVRMASDHEFYFYWFLPQAGRRPLERIANTLNMKHMEVKNTEMAEKKQVHV